VRVDLSERGFANDESRLSFTPIHGDAPLAQRIRERCSLPASLCVTESVAFLAQSGAVP
jgi:hypothetical protein